MIWLHNIAENQWVCDQCGYMRPGRMPAEEHDCGGVDMTEPRRMAADDVDAIRARLKDIRHEG